MWSPISLLITKTDSLGQLALLAITVEDRPRGGTRRCIEYRCTDRKKIVKLRSNLGSIQWVLTCLSKDSNDYQQNASKKQTVDQKNSFEKITSTA
jgi:hypothetical protein